MAQIGSFTRTEQGYKGRLKTLTLDVDLTIVPIQPTDADHAPDYRIYLGPDDHGLEVGAGWKRSGEKAGNYLSLLIDDPMFTQPLRANLFQVDAKGRSFHLLWNRPAKHDDQR
jgi:uncharacterized protein (DUF736 family)